MRHKQAIIINKSDKQTKLSLSPLTIYIYTLFRYFNDN